NLDEILRRHSEVTVELRVAKAGGAIVVAKPTTDVAVLAVTQRRPKDVRALASVPEEAPRSLAASSSALSALLVSPFKAAPFRDPFTGLDYMRDRWYDK